MACHDQRSYWAEHLVCCGIWKDAYWSLGSGERPNPVLQTWCLGKSNLGFHKESFHFMEGIIRILCVSRNGKTEEFSYYQITCAYVDILVELWTTHGFQDIQTHSLFNWDAIRNTMFTSKELRFDHLVSTGVKAQRKKRNGQGSKWHRSQSRQENRRSLSWLTAELPFVQQWVW